MKKLVVGIAFLSAFGCAKAQTADEIVSKHIEAIGGKANIDKLQNVVMEGGMNVQGADMNIKFTKARGKLSRRDINIAAMGITGYDLTTDKDGWTFMPMMGQTTPVEKTGDALKAAQQDMELSDDLYNYKTKGNKVELKGKEDVSGTDCFKLEVTDASGTTETVYVDPATWYITRVSSLQKFSGMEIPVVMDFSDYKEVDGVKFPFSMGTPQGTIVFTSIKVNQTIDEKLYKHD